MNHTRRTFIKSGLIAAAGAPFVLRGFTLNAADTKKSKDALFEQFRNPQATAKPFVRWWWNGDKVTEREILRELDVMKAAGIGGVEINPIAFPGGDDLSIPSLRWLSPEWIEMIKVALKGAEERGMICDIIVGSGWPFGAEFLEKEERSQIMTQCCRRVSGTVTIEVDELLKAASPEVNHYKDAVSDLYALYLAPVGMDKFSAPKPIPFDSAAKTVTIHAPEGEHVLYALVKITGFQAVINGAPGAAGPVLNHYNKDAALRFLNRMSDTLFPELKGCKPFRAMFCDSMELEGANWCQDFTDEFKRRRGYDVAPYLPFILYKVGGMGRPIISQDATKLSGEAADTVARVRYDFFITCLELVRDRFLLTYTQWCNKHGFKSRVQTYGREFHPLEASMHIDIPECETWVWKPHYTNVNKFVASAAHYSGKKIVSCEESTNTSEVFNVTLNNFKAICDQSNISGVNHSIIHGFNYTPLEAPFPGWIRYGMYLNERNLWWEYFNQWATYKARISTVLQETEAFADIAVMHPLADMWTKHGTQRDPFPELLYPEYQYKVWEGVHKNGNSCDYISEGIIQQSKTADGWLTYSTRKYHTIILLEVETIMPQTLDKLSDFVRNGGKIIFVGKEPHLSPGLINHSKNDAKVKQTLAAMKAKYAARIFTVEAPDKDIVAWFGKIQRQCDIKPYMQIDSPNANISQIRHIAEGKDIYFISNASFDERVAIQATFPQSKGAACLWNPETGERYRYPSISGDKLIIDLPPAASQLIVFDTQANDIADLPSQPAETVGKELTGWTLRMEHINGTEKTVSLSTLRDLSADEATRSFAGWLYYEKIFDGIASFNWLDLGKVYGVSEVTIDGENIGNRWYGRHIYRIPEHLKKSGEHRLTVKITTTLGNYFKSNPENRTGHGWTRGQEWQPAGMTGAVRLL
ncbi:MAG: hypothetical protein LBG92_05320 [Prevotellaceae bacterium]|jgi:hypothetical protein|nr:hypothetical protein [Prevotellaceae bacterium]